jgi:shikimate dehydrogenase
MLRASSAILMPRCRIGTKGWTASWCWALAVLLKLWCSVSLSAESNTLTLPTGVLTEADAFRHRYGSVVRPLGWTDMRGPLSEVSLLVNATSLGMRNQPVLEIDLSEVLEHAIVTDLIYAPLETRLLATAKVRGLRTVDGLGMLLHQAVRGFSLWFGVRPQVTSALRALVEADLAKS